jgi:hypothetical protein
MHNKVLAVFHIQYSTLISNSLYTTDNLIVISETYKHNRRKQWALKHTVNADINRAFYLLDL